MSESRVSESSVRSRRDASLIALIAFAARAIVVGWAAPRFPPADDGTYYHRIAERIAEGLGYTWLWPDGVVTYAAHYPVGYPAMAGALYAVFGPRPGVAMLLNAVLGALAAVAVHRLAARTGSRRVALIAGLLVALHPGLVAYTPALMTEGITGSLLACAAWVSAAARDELEASSSLRRGLVFTAAAGAVVGLATLVRPQAIVLAPLFAWIAWSGARRSLRASSAGAVAGLCAALLVCAPWTIRNCHRMKSCALVSVNGGWNLLIGADPVSTGSWSPVKVPDACREVFDEAQKDACFGREAIRYIREHPSAWVSLIPKKLAATFDSNNAAGYYLHTSNPDAFSERARTALGVIETAFERLTLLLALVWSARAFALTRRERPVTAILGGSLLALAAVFLALTHAWISYAAFTAAALLQGRALLRGPLLPAAAVAVLLATLLTHAAVFGAGRYSLPVFPLLCGVAALAFLPAGALAIAARGSDQRGFGG